MRRRTVTLGFLVVFMGWNILTYILLAGRTPSKQSARDVQLFQGIHDLELSVKSQIQQRESLIHELKKLQEELVQNLAAEDQKVPEANPKLSGPLGQKLMAVIEQKDNSKHTDIKQDIEDVRGQAGDSNRQPAHHITEEDPTKVVLPVLVIACNRPSINVNLDQLIRTRPSADRFPVIVSQDCGHAQTADVIKSYGEQITHIEHPDLSDIKLGPKEKKFQGYYKIARHYKWALNQVFNRFNYSAVIIVEDDLNIAPDFFEYFAATFPVLCSDPSLWCVSAWNDNGKAGMISDEAELLYRTDFFPGLGWMMERKTWLELEVKWPATFWDDWMRHPDQRQEKSCIRPEISRTNTFGKIGVSKGQFYEKHLKYIKLNENFVPFTQKDLSYLSKDKYDAFLVNSVYSAPLLTTAQVLGRQRQEEKVVRVQYTDKNSFRLQAKQLGIMEDLKSGVPRAGYRGIVSFMKDGRRVYFSPPSNWNGYDPTWN